MHFGKAIYTSANKIKSQTIEKAVKKWRSKEDRDNEDNLHLVEPLRVIVVDSVAFFKRTFLSRS